MLLILRNIALLQGVVQLCYLASAGKVGGDAASTCAEEDEMAALQVRKTGKSEALHNHTTGDPGQCPSNQPDPHCGGSTDAWNEMSCSPYKYRPFTYNYQNPNSCDGDIFDILTYGGDKARPWAHFTNSQWDTDDYWVFHGCDGAGLQPDCLGDVKYVEHFQGHVAGGGGPTTLDQECTHNPDNDQRNYCKFVHPGTFTTYNNYESGWWNDGNAGGAAPNGITGYMVGSAATSGWGEWLGGKDITGKDCEPSMPQCYKQSKMVFDHGNQYIDLDGQLNEKNCPMRAISYTTFSWVCTSSDSPNDNFAYPSWGGGSKNVKCYADNEPGDNGGNPGWPRYVYIYYMLLYKSGGKGDGTDCTDPEGWTIKGQKYWLNEDGSGVGGPEDFGGGDEFYIEPCHNGDGCPF